MKVLVFDTETTGIIPKSYLPLDKMPYIVQLGFMLYDTDKNEIIINFNEIIKIPDQVTIPEGASNVHRIYKKDCDEKGIDIKNAIMQFQKAYDKADLVVAHNITFDNRMVMLECERIGMECFLLEEISFCTMKNSTKLTNIIATNYRGTKYVKSPKLSELHQHFFGYVPRDLHDAFIDLLVCLRCFCQLSNKPVDICDHNEYIRDVFAKIR
jgi:DNA polymerase III epsilon subunit-like protein